jgi:hypothetical protein
MFACCMLIRGPIELAIGTRSRSLMSDSTLMIAVGQWDAGFRADQSRFRSNHSPDIAILQQFPPHLIPNLHHATVTDKN